MKLRYATVLCGIMALIATGVARAGDEPQAIGKKVELFPNGSKRQMELEKRWIREGCRDEKTLLVKRSRKRDANELGLVTRTTNFTAGYVDFVVKRKRSSVVCGVIGINFALTKAYRIRLDEGRFRDADTDYMTVWLRPKRG